MYPELTLSNHDQLVYFRARTAIDEQRWRVISHISDQVSESANKESMISTYNIKPFCTSEDIPKRPESALCDYDSRLQHSIPNPHTTLRPA